MAWELDSRGSIYGQLVEIIVRRIVTGVYPAGAKMDSVRDLAAEAGVNPNTMQRALTELERTGIISTQRTSGKFVTEDQNMIDEMRTRLAEEAVAQLMKEMKELGFDKDSIVDMIRRNQDERDNGMS